MPKEPAGYVSWHVMMGAGAVVLTRRAPPLCSSTRDFSGAAPDATPAGGERPAPYRSSTSNASWSSRGSGSRGDDDTRFRDLRGGSRRGQRRGSNGNAAAGANGGPRGDPYVRKDSYRSMDSFRSDDSHNDGTRDFEGLRRGRSGCVPRLLACCGASLKLTFVVCGTATTAAAHPLVLTPRYRAVEASHASHRVAATLEVGLGARRCASVASQPR